jgi:large repetitive protein
MAGQQEVCVRLCTLITMAWAMAALGSVGRSGPCRAAQPEPRFDPKGVVRQVQALSDMSGSSSGEPSRAPGKLSDRVPESASKQSLDDGVFLLDTSSTLVPAPGSQNNPAIAFDGVDFLVVWEDYRSGDHSDICGARVTPQGTVLDPSGFVISQAPYDQSYPAVGFDGANFFVVWQDFRRGYAFDIYGARVTPEGAVLDPTGLIVSNDPNVQQHPAISFDGTNFLVVWQDNRNDVPANDIYGARVTPQGTVLDPAGFVVSQAAHSQYNPAISFGGTDYLVAWQDSRDSVACHIYGARVTPAGAVLDTGGFVVSLGAKSQLAPCLSFDGTNYLVAWEDIVGSMPFASIIHGTRVTPAGVVLDPSGIAISSEGIQTVPALTFDGQNFLAVWQNAASDLTGFYSIHGARVTPDGAVLDGSELVIAHGPASVSLAVPADGFDGANFLVVWQDNRNDTVESDVYGARVSPGGVVLDTGGLLITQAAREELAPAVAFDNANFLVAWEDHRGGGYSDVYGARVTPGGTVVDPQGFVITQSANDQLSPALGFDGANFLAVWEDYRNGETRDIYGARVTPDGTVLDTSGFVITQAASVQGSPALAFDGGNFLVTWEDRRSGGRSDVYGARVTPGGTVLDPDGIAITQAANDQLCPALAFDGANFLVVWQDYRGDSGYSDVYGARVTPGGTVLDPEGFAVSQARYDQGKPAVGFDGANFLAVWEDYRRGTYSDIYGARVTPGGAVLDGDGIVITEATKYQYAPVLAFDGSSFLVTWEDYRSSNNPDIYGAWVAPNGIVSDEGGIVREAGDQTSLALARGNGSQLFLVYQGWVGTIGDKTYNTDRIWGDMNPSTGLGFEESRQSVTRGYQSIATVVRGVLFLGDRTRTETVSRTVLLDSSGRKVMDLRPGANDVRALAPGVYFVRDAADEGGTRKVVVQR